ncbi:RAS guanyl-releasing protein 1-like isoform X2 [Cyclopterus lumpus]|uniref:RAS guanyl-releasing protein 1-like isoform X2 n=1 Tax=Cyclopterus lumpus TaxID=8103 RepID=UPI001486DCEA|nr:RAS guanyl-releasing protein 1-like isoform X2 [Cyclopterus lumpus]
MDSLVQPLVAQYLAMGCQSKENNQNESITSDEKGKEDARVSPGCSSRSRVSPPGRPHRFHKPSPAQTTPGKSMMSLGPLTKGGSWEDLIQACLQSFDSDGGVCGSSHLLNITLTMHRIHISSCDLLDKLTTLFKIALDNEQTTECQRICYLIRHWIQEFWMMFRLHHSLSDSLEQFRELIREQGQEHLCSLLETKWINERDWSWKASQKIKANSSKKRKVSLLFDHLEPIELAEHLTFLEFKSFCRISFVDFQNYIRSCCMKDIPVMERSIALCNGISQWVQLMVLSRPTAQLRAEVFTKFIHVAQNLHLMHNYNTLMAVVGGLCHSSISRLKDTTSHVSNEVTKVLNEMTDLLSSCRNYDNYRQAYNKCTGFKIPILGVHLKDLISVNEAMSDYVEDNKVNVQKLQALYNHINELIQLQQIPPRLDANKDLVHLLTLSLDLYYTEDEIYELSYTREPKNCKAPPPPLDLQWLWTGHQEWLPNPIPEPSANMCREWWMEGLISREEITAYFMRASVICSKLGLGFVHNFQETTYMKPTFCDNCSGFLWGVIKQGYRCRDCGMNCHKLCKEQVAFECKKNAKVTNAIDSPTPSSSSVTMGTSEGSEECPFPYPPDDSKDWSPDSPVTSYSRPRKVHSATQTEGLQLSSADQEASYLQPSLLVPTPPPLTSCPSPVLQRKQRHCVKWENRASVVQKPKEPDEENKPTYESLESDNQRLQNANGTLRRKLKDAEREVEILKTLLKRHALHPVEEDSSS